MKLRSIYNISFKVAKSVCLIVSLWVFGFQGPCYINFDRFPYDKIQAEEEFSDWDCDF